MYPNYNQYLNELWGWPDELAGFIPIISIASNVIIGTNPPYSITDFFAMYPQFGGTPIQFSAGIDGTTNVLFGVSNTAGLAVGQYVAGIGIQTGSTITQINDTNVTLSLPTTIAGAGVTVTVYPNPLIPVAVLNAYVYLASNSIMQARWCEMWQLGMALFIAHYATLWGMAQSSATTPTIQQVASAGLSFGIKTSKSAGDVSVGSTPITIDGFGAWNLTAFGLQLATLAAVVGSGNMLLY